MSHHHHSGACGHDHHDDDSHVKADEGEQDLLYGSIDRDQVVVLNEAVDGSGVGILKTWADRFSSEPELVSDADDQLILHIPFTSSVKLSTLLFRPPSNAECTPVTLKLYKNLAASSINFDDIASIPDSAITTTLDSIPSIHDTNASKQLVAIPLKPVKWANTDSITIFIDASVGGDLSGLLFLGFKGKSSGLTREAPQNIVYESAPQLKDHTKVQGMAAGHQFGQ